MADRSLLDAYLRRLGAALPLAESERTAAVEEIAAHLADTTAELVERGLPADVAERRALSRLGAPERLADDLAAAHRAPRDLLIATGVALRLGIVTVVRSVLATWVLIFVIGIALALPWTLANRVFGLGAIDWTLLTNGPLAGLTMSLAAYAVGRTIVRPVASAAHRPQRTVRIAILAIGIPLAAWIGLAWIALEWNLIGVVLAVLLPAWFALGIVRPRLLPAWFPLERPRVALALIAVILVSLAGLSVAGAPYPGGEGRVREVDPATEFAAIAPLADTEALPLEDIAAHPLASGYDRGAGPIGWSQDWRLTGASSSLAGWRDVQVEVWTSTQNEMTGPLVVGSTIRIASAPLTVSGGLASTWVMFEALPDTEFYYLAVVGIGADGQRELLAWPTFRQWIWSGTPWQYLVATLAGR